MYARHILAAALAAMALGGGAALAGNGVNVRILNDTPNNLSVTIYDRNAHPPQAVISSEVVDGNASISVFVSADSSGTGHLSWTATTVDRDMARCGSGQKRGLNDGDTVHVRANHRCHG